MIYLLFMYAVQALVGLSEGLKQPQSPAHSETDSSAPNEEKIIQKYVYYPKKVIKGYQNITIAISMDKWNAYTVTECSLDIDCTL